MNYHGRIFGKIRKKYFELDMTTKDIEFLKSEIENLKKITSINPKIMNQLFRVTASLNGKNVFNISLSNVSLQYYEKVILVIQGTDCDKKIVASFPDSYAVSCLPEITFKSDHETNI